MSKRCRVQWMCYCLHGHRGRRRGSLSELSSLCPGGRKIVSYGLKAKELKVLTNDFAAAFDPCTYWDGEKFTFAGVHKKGGGCRIWEMNVDGGGVRQMTDYKGYLSCSDILCGWRHRGRKGRIIWRDRYFEGDWKERGTVETGIHHLCRFTGWCDG